MIPLCTKTDRTIFNNITVTAHILPSILNVCIDVKQYNYLRAPLRVKIGLVRAI